MRYSDVELVRVETCETVRISVKARGIRTIRLENIKVMTADKLLFLTTFLMR